MFRPTYSDYMYTWQIYATAYLLSMVGNHRTYLHLFDLHGNSGKSWFASILKTHHRDKLCLIDAAGQYGDMVDASRGELESCEIVIIDASRSENNRKSIAKLVENVMNGRVTATKYECDAIQCKANFVILMSNEPPFPGRLSLDRTICIELTAKPKYGGPAGIEARRRPGDLHREYIQNERITEYYPNKKMKVVGADPQARLIDPEMGWHAHTKDWIRNEMSFEAFVCWKRENGDDYERVATMFADPCKDCDWNQVDPDEHNRLGFAAGMAAKKKRAHIDTGKLRYEHMKGIEMRKLEAEADEAMMRISDGEDDVVDESNQQIVVSSQ